MLTDREIRTAQASDRPRKLFDGQGLYLLISPAGSKLWRLKYRYGGREKLLALGSYPTTSLKKARQKRDSAKEQLEDGLDPALVRQAEKIARGNTFRGVAVAWVEEQRRKARIAPQTLAAHEARLVRYVYPKLGRRPIAEITAPELLAVLRDIEAKGRGDTTHRVRRLCGQILRYGIALQLVDRNVAEDVKGILEAPHGAHYPAITDPKQVGALLRALDGYEGQAATVAALRLLPLVFVRPGELRGAEWPEFDLDAAVWRIPAVRMKMKSDHLVPLSRQAVGILREIEALTGAGRLVFPANRPGDRPLSENTLNGALRRLGYSKETMVSHGFRSMASTLLNEQGWPPDVIELQLAHQERNKVRAAYNRAQRIEERTRMMQAWADYLDGLKSGGVVVAIHQQRVAGSARGGQ